MRHESVACPWHVCSSRTAAQGRQLKGCSTRPAQQYQRRPLPRAQVLLARLTMLCIGLQPPDRSSFKAILVEVVPTGISTAGDVAMSNLSLLYITITYYTVVKSSVPFWILLFSIAYGLQKARLDIMLVLLMISSGIAIASFEEDEPLAIGDSATKAASALAAEDVALLEDELLLGLDEGLDGGEELSSGGARQPVPLTASATHCRHSVAHISRLCTPRVVLAPSASRGKADKATTLTVGVRAPHAGLCCGCCGTGARFPRARGRSR